jgi:heme/copper-type cytochrome/quinol oxidase subunit 3
MSMTASMAAPRPDEAAPGIPVYNQKLGMWVFLLSEVMFFTSLIGSYIILRMAHPEAWAAPGDVLNIPLTAFNTFVLICSSVTMVKAFAAAENRDPKGIRFWLLMTILLGVFFLGVQAFEYYKLAGHGFVPSIEGYAAEGGPLYGSTFYTMTGFHGAHVFLGVVALCFTLFRAMRGAYDTGSYGGVEVMGLYWHFVDLVWIILFTIVYLM